VLFLGSETGRGRREVEKEGGETKKRGGIEGNESGGSRG
jgi:hypothetical protein